MTEPSDRLSGSTWDVEQLLTDALRPIEPPERLSGRLEDTLAAVTQAAAGGAATGALVLLELRRRSRSRSQSGLRALTSGLRSRL
jgi:hypothetical protein